MLHQSKSEEGRKGGKGGEGKRREGKEDHENMESSNSNVRVKGIPSMMVKENLKVAVFLSSLESKTVQICEDQKSSGTMSLRR